MTLDTRGWSAVMLTGTSPRLIIEGEARTHPYAIAYLTERTLFRCPPDTLCMDLRVIGDQGALDLLDWKRVVFEQALRGAIYQHVVIGGTGAPIRVDVRRVPASTYARGLRR